MGSNWNAERVAAWEPSARPYRAAAGVTACRTRRRVVTAGVCIATVGLLVGVQWSGVTVLGELESPESAALAHALEAHLVRDTERRVDAAIDTGTVGREERSRKESDDTSYDVFVGRFETSVFESRGSDANKKTRFVLFSFSESAKPNVRKFGNLQSRCATVYILEIPMAF